MLHPFRSAPFTEAATPARPFPWARFAVMVAAILAIHAREDIARWWHARGQRQTIAATQGTARAEQNAAAWVRSAYGVDPWVRCHHVYDGGRTCDVVIRQAAPLVLHCATTPGGACRVGGAR